jgi:hypothetical protein
MKAMCLVLIALVLLGLAACGGGGKAESDGWAKAERESLTQDCIKYVIAEGGLSNSYASQYCKCWISGMEAHYTAEYADTIINQGAMPDPEVMKIGTECQ